VLPEAFIADDLASGRLQRVLPLWSGPPTPVYAITETRLLPAKTARFIDFLRDRLAQPSTHIPDDTSHQAVHHAD
jgi:DNA-binding transcriptional LysR family regulator